MSVDDAVRPVVRPVDRPASAAVVPAVPALGELPVLPTRLVSLAQRPALGLLSLPWRIAIHGADRVPPQGPVILAANHIAVLDGPLVVAASPRRLTFALAKCELFAGGVGAFLRRCGQIPVDRGRFDPGSVRRCLQVLTDGHALAIFPEGVRGAGQVAHAHHGAAYLAMLTGAPVVPVAILGTRDPGTSTRSLPPLGRRIDVVYGDPLPVAAVPWPRRRSAVAEITERVRRRLADHVVDAQQLTGRPLPGEPPRITTAA